MEYNHIKRIEGSDYFGSYLSIDLFNMKTCTFNCIHCRAGPTINQIPQRVYLYPVTKVLDEIKDSIANNGKVDYIKYSHRGDQTLYVLFGSLNKKIKEEFPNIKIATCTNCSMLSREDIFSELKNVDIVIASLDSVIDEEFRRINRPLEKITLTSILNNIKKFSSEYNGKLWINSVILKGYNDSEESLTKLKHYLDELQPDNFLITFDTIISENVIDQNFKLKLVDLFVDTPYDVQIGVDRP